VLQAFLLRLEHELLSPVEDVLTGVADLALHGPRRQAGRQFAQGLTGTGTGLSVLELLPSWPLTL
jgi:hypothetical protein